MYFLHCSRGQTSLEIYMEKLLMYFLHRSRGQTSLFIIKWKANSLLTSAFFSFYMKN